MNSTHQTFPFRFQFSIRTMLCMCIGCAIFFSVARWASAPHTMIYSSLLILIAFPLLRRSQQWALCLFTISWLLASAFVTHSLIDSFKCIGWPPSKEEMQFRFMESYLQAIPLPLFLSLLFIYRWSKEKREFFRERNLYLVCTTCALVDCTLSTLLLSLLHQMDWPFSWR